MATPITDPTAPPHDPIGQRLKQIRQMRGWSQRYLAAQSGIAQNTICDLETGKARAQAIELGTAMRLAWALGVSLDALSGMPMIPGVPNGTS